jgi:hypothetical protein
MTLSAEERERFVADGFVVVRRAFPREVAEAGCAFVSKLIGVPDVPPPDVDLPAIAARLVADGVFTATHEQPMVHVQHAFGGPPFDRVLTPRLRTALDEIMGVGRFVVHDKYGWWPVLFPGFPGPGGWHVDSVPMHHLTSPERGLVTVFLFSDVGPGEGGTPFVRGSHAAVARMIADAEPAGVMNEALVAALPTPESDEIVHLTGEAGDVALMHPFLMHGFGPNRGTRLRFACNPLYALREPMQLERADGAYSPVEEATRRALGR